MEIERKYLITKAPENYNHYPNKRISQGYISTEPVIRIRQLDDHYILTVKGNGLLAREEFELSISQQEYKNLSHKVQGTVISKTRYYIPFDKYTIEFDVFDGDYKGLMLAEVEFESIDEANNFIPPPWFTKDVTEDGRYQNSRLSQGEGPNF